MKDLKISIVFILFMLLPSCFEDELYLTPYNGITDTEFFKTEENAEAALIPCYRGRSWWRLPNTTIDYYGDPSGTGAWSGPANSSANQWWQKAVTPENEFVAGHYQNIYQQYISKCNSFLYFVQDTPFRDPKRKLAAQAEARFLRAMYYHILTMIFGSVPNVTTLPPPLHPYRATSEENYTQIIEDLEYCIENLPETNIGVLRPGEWECRPDKFSAKALLAKVLMMAPEPLYDLDRAITFTDEVIKSGKYELEPFYGDLMQLDNKDNNEGVFMINFTNGMAHPFDGSNAGSLSVPEQIWFRPTWEFYHTFEEGDTRRDVNIERLLIVLPMGDTIRDEIYVLKFRYDRRTLNGFTHDSYPQWVIRLADMLLLRAEQLAKRDGNLNNPEIFSLIEQVRNRAFRGNPHKIYSASDFSTMDEFWEFLWWERRKELYFETHTFFDAKRMGMCQKMLGLEKWQEVLPFSTDDLTLNPNLEQNPGY